MKQFDDLPVPQVVEESTVERIDGLPVCGDGTDGSGVGVHGEAGEGGRRGGRCRTRSAFW